MGISNYYAIMEIKLTTIRPLINNDWDNGNKAPEYFIKTSEEA